MPARLDPYPHTFRNRIFTSYNFFAQFFGKSARIREAVGGTLIQSYIWIMHIQ